MKGIILAGGKGTRLYPTTIVTPKALLPVYDKPMIYYPLSILMMAGIRDILIISSSQSLPQMKQLLGDGSKLGIHISHMIQRKPRGIADAFLIGKEFVGDEPCALILCDNIFYQPNLQDYLVDAIKYAESQNLSTIFGYKVNDPHRFGIVEIDGNGKPISIEEKPEHPKSNICITGLYFYPAGVCELVKELVPSKRGELEITDLNNIYLKEEKLCVNVLKDCALWMDAGTLESLAEANIKIEELQKKTNSIIACVEEIALKNNWITKEMLSKELKLLGSSQYGKYLAEILNKD